MDFVESEVMDLWPCAGVAVDAAAVDDDVDAAAAELGQQQLQPLQPLLVFVGDVA